MVVKKYFAFLLFAIFCVFFTINTSAEVETELYTERSLSEFKEDYAFVKKNTETDDMSIVTFDVSENGLIALSKEYSIQRQRVVDIYDSNGIFLYGFIFNTPGTIKVEWRGNELDIIFCKADIIMSVSENGEPYKLSKLVRDKQYYAHMRELNSDRRHIDSTVYELEKPTLIPRFFGFSKVKVEIEGIESIILDFSGAQIVRFCIFIAIVTVVLAVFVGIFIYALKNAPKNHPNNM